MQPNKCRNDMKIKENVTVYKCEYCKKKLFRKHSMVRHEEFCSYNPKNTCACSGCEHIEETTNTYYTNYCDNLGYQIEKTTIAFHCKKLDKMLYPLKVARLKLDEKYPETFEGQELMPNKCESRQTPDYSSIFDI